MNAEELPQLVTTEDHVAGYKDLTLATYAGDIRAVCIRRLTYTETLQLPRTQTGAIDPLEILKASLPPDLSFEDFNRQIVPEDCDRAHLTALYLSWGIEKQKKMVAASIALAAAMFGDPSSNSNVNASAPATDSPRSDPGLCPGSFCNTESPSAASGGGC